jgi:CRP/FNR family transcriptional regulator, cyclic AMP receptor protein
MSDRGSQSRLKTDEPISAERLQTAPVLAGLSQEVLTYLASALPVLMLKAGDCVFLEGDPAREMFILVDGELEILKKSRRGKEARVAILGPGDAFGEMSVLDLQPRSATVRAVSPVRVVRMSTEELDALYRRDLKAYSMLVLNIARDLSRRLRVADGLVAQLAATVLDEYGPKR